MLKARVHPIWVGGRVGYVYSVIRDCELLVDPSRDPEFDAARALAAKGITGKLTMLDSKIGKPRTVIDIERAAKLCTEETANAPRFRKWRERGGSATQTAETDDAAGGW